MITKRDLFEQQRQAFDLTHEDVIDLGRKSWRLLRTNGGGNLDNGSAPEADLVEYIRGLWFKIGMTLGLNRGVREKWFPRLGASAASNAVWMVNFILTEPQADEILAGIKSGHPTRIREQVRKLATGRGVATFSPYAKILDTLDEINGSMSDMSLAEMNALLPLATAFHKAVMANHIEKLAKAGYDVSEFTEDESATG